MAHPPDGRRALPPAFRKESTGPGRFLVAGRPIRNRPENVSPREMKRHTPPRAWCARAVRHDGDGPPSETRSNVEQEEPVTGGVLRGGAGAHRRHPEAFPERAVHV